MNVFDLRSQRSLRSSLPEVTPAPTQEPRFMDLARQMGAEIAGPLSSALDRLNQLSSSGKIDAKGLRALQAEVSQARRFGIMGQQLCRLASGSLLHAPEVVNLTKTVAEALQQRGDEVGVNAVAVRTEFVAAHVSVDPALLFMMLQGMLDWSFQHARASVEWQLQPTEQAGRVRLSCQFEHDALGRVASARLNSVNYRLVQQTAIEMGLECRRKDSEAKACLSVEFECVGAAQPALSTLAQGKRPRGGADPLHSLVGHHVLVLASQRDTRAQVRQAMADMGLMLDFVTTVAEAQAFCLDGLPHAVVYEQGMAGADFDRLRRQILAEVPAFGFVEITEHGAGIETHPRSRTQPTRVGRSAIGKVLLSALVYELSKPA